jgi:hypothetical protein
MRPDALPRQVGLWELTEGRNDDNRQVHLFQLKPNIANHWAWIMAERYEPERTHIEIQSFGERLPKKIPTGMRPSYRIRAAWGRKDTADLAVGHQRRHFDETFERRARGGGSDLDELEFATPHLELGVHNAMDWAMERISRLISEIDWRPSEWIPEDSCT